MIARRSARTRRGISLLEIILAMGLLVMLSSMTYWFYGSAIETTRRGGVVARDLRLVRSVLDRMATEVRQSSLITADNRVGIRGLGDRIWLSTLRVPSRASAKQLLSRDEQRPGQYDMVKVEYKIARSPDIQDEEGGYDKALGLARVEILIPRPDSAQLGQALKNGSRQFGAGDGENGGAVEEAILSEQLLDGVTGSDGGKVRDLVNFEEIYAKEIGFLRLCYFDGNKWWDEWKVDGENPLPQMVLVTVGFEPAPPLDDPNIPRELKDFCTCMNEDPVNCPVLSKDRYQTLIRVPQADPLFRSRITREAQFMTSNLRAGTEGSSQDTSQAGDQQGNQDRGGGR